MLRLQSYIMHRLLICPPDASSPALWRHVQWVYRKIARGRPYFNPLKLLPLTISHSLVIQIYYSIIYPFLIYGAIVWGNTYKSNVLPLTLLQKKAIRIITFSPPRTHSSPLFKELNLLKFPDIVHYLTVLFMYQFHHGTLPLIFSDFFKKVVNVHNYHLNYRMLYLRFELTMVSLILDTVVHSYGILLRSPWNC